MATYLADRVIVYDGVPSVKARAQTPESLLTGMNKFWKSWRSLSGRDPTNFRPRINKSDSVKDKEQKLRFVFVLIIAVIIFLSRLQNRDESEICFKRYISLQGLGN